MTGYITLGHYINLASIFIMNDKMKLLLLYFVKLYIAYL